MVKKNTEIESMEKRNALYQQEKNRYIENKRENIQTDLITITEDKLENILLKSQNSLTQRSDWKTPVSLFVTTLTTILTSDFKDFLFKKEIWNALYILLIIGSFIWLIVNIIRIIKKPKKETIESLINKIANR